MEGTKATNLITIAANLIMEMVPYNILSLLQTLTTWKHSSNTFNKHNLAQEVGLSNLELPINQSTMVINNLSITTLKIVKMEERATLFKSRFKFNNEAKAQIK
jgi:hypothetical protein